MHKISIIGNLGSDIEKKVLDSGSVVRNVSVAVNERYTSDGEKVEKTTWYRIALWGEERWKGVAPYLTKGTQVYIEGIPKASAWVDDAGQARVRNEITGNFLLLLSGGNGKADDSEDFAPPAEEEDGDIPF
jgi:single-strand DNA-binding protein